MNDPAANGLAYIVAALFLAFVALAVYAVFILAVRAAVLAVMGLVVLAGFWLVSAVVEQVGCLGTVLLYVGGVTLFVWIVDQIERRPPRMRPPNH